MAVDQSSERAAPPPQPTTPATDTRPESTTAHPAATASRPDAQTPTRRGRRPGPTTTRQGVLDAARARFAADGFGATTIRRVAADAGVDASQVMQFYRSKDELFAAVMAIRPSALERFDTAFEGPDEHLGERVVRASLSAWEGPPEESEPLMAMLRGAIVNDQASDQLREFIQSRLLQGTSERTDADAALRAGLASSMLVGVVTGRRIVGVPTLVAADREELVATLAPAIQQILVPASGIRTASTPGADGDEAGDITDAGADQAATTPPPAGADPSDTDGPATEDGATATGEVTATTEAPAAGIVSDQAATTTAPEDAPE
ncbi:TetR family transcriptional regulator [Glaciibacter flavus]|uniref:TetR/AcrR family transcriptional regulator n=1 Tax=Orlajensenia flava TaxID=2565934 RepID=UPI003B00A9BE